LIYVLNYYFDNSLSALEMISATVRGIVKCAAFASLLNLQQCAAYCLDDNSRDKDDFLTSIICKGKKAIKEFKAEEIFSSENTEAVSRQVHDFINQGVPQQVQ